jgi:N6-L-threonylcarbamoyladenine synthase
MTTVITQTILPMKILGIETSCDETAVAIVQDDRKILSHLVLSQIDEHQPYGGVVPEIAARAHIDALDSLIKNAMLEAKITDYSKLDAIAVTAGPGLIGGVIVGVMMAKAIASAANIPIIAVNHLEGHALTIRLVEDAKFPFMMLLVSGGHCQVLVVEGVGKYKKLGSTIDDSLGEAFDKVAKMMGLPYPGGPIVEQRAKLGDPKRFDFPRSMRGREGCDFSFSGLKTAVKRAVDEIGNLSEQDINDVCASFQTCVGDILEERLGNAIKMYSNLHPNSNSMVLAGGVAANKYINERLQNVTGKHGFTLQSPPMKLCTDNGAMIAWAGIERMQAGFVDDLHFVPKARWPLDSGQ